jgi:hypothetical protein
MRYWLWRAWKWAVLVVVGVSLAVVPSVAQGSATIIILPSSIVPYPTPVFIQISGTWRDSCKPKPPFNVSIIGTTITIRSSDTSSPCMAVITSWGPHTFSVGVLPPGTYLVQVFHTANDGTHLLGMRTFVVVAVQPPQRRLSDSSDAHSGRLRSGSVCRRALPARWGAVSCHRGHQS